MTSGDQMFDVVAAVARAVALDLTVASPEELNWSDRAGDRIRAWVDAWQARVQFEKSLPRPLPPVPGAAGTDDADPAGGSDGAASGAADEGADSAEAAEHAGSAAPDESAPNERGELPSLGSERPVPLSAAEQARQARRSWLLSCLPAFADALRTGRLSTGHVDTLATAADRLPTAVGERVLARGDELLRDACAMTPERFSRAVQRAISKAYEDEGIDRAAALRNRSCLRRGVDDATRMHWYRLELDPERGTVLDGQLDAEREAIFRRGGQQGVNRERLELQALLNLIGVTATDGSARPADLGDTDVAPAHAASAASGTSGTLDASAGASAGGDDPGGDRCTSCGSVRGAPHAGGRRATSRKSSTKKVRGLVLIDATTWLNGVHDHSVCESGAGIPLPPETVRRLLCIAELSYGVMINGRLVAQVANNDLATEEQRDGLRSMYRTCAAPGCTRLFDICQIHHIIARARNGPTDIALMIPLCNEHHDAIHHRDWQVAIDPERNLTWTYPDGGRQWCRFVPLDQLDVVGDLSPPTLFDHPPAA